MSNTKKKLSVYKVESEWETGHFEGRVFTSKAVALREIKQFDWVRLLGEDNVEEPMLIENLMKEDLITITQIPVYG